MGLFSTLFGGSKQKSHSENKAYPFIQQTFGGPAGFTGDAGNMIKSLLGMGGDSSGFNKYLDSAGYNHVINSGSKAITGNQASRGLLRSGSTGKALINFGQQVGQSFLDRYLSHAMGLGNLGLGAGGLITGAGQVSDSTGSSKPGIGGFLGSLIGGIAASDRRLKKNIKELGEVEGLVICSFDYIDGRGPYIGVMADDVSAKFPEALGPEIAGYKTVDYDKLAQIIDGGK